MRSSALLGALLACGAAAAARGEGNGNGNGNGNGHRFSTGATLRAAYDDVAVRRAGGWEHRGMLAQTYGADVAGPLGVPLLGTGRATFGYQDGSNVSRMLQGGESRQQQSDLSLSGALFPDELRKVVQVSPFLTRSQYTASTPGAPSRDFIDTTVGGAGSLSFPGWPVVAVAYRTTGREDSSRPGATGDATASREDKVRYANGPWRFRYDRQVRASAPAGASAARTDADDVHSSVEFQQSNNGLAKWRLQNLNGSVGYGGSRLGAGARRGAFTEQVNLATVRRTFGGIGWHVGLGQGVATTPGSSAAALTHDLSLNASKGVPHLDVSNQLAIANRSGGFLPSNRVRDLLSAETRWWESRLGYAVQGEASAAWEPGGASTGEGISQRLSVSPASAVDLFATHAYAAGRARGGGPSSLTTKTGGGGAWRPFPGVDVRATIERSRARAPATPAAAWTTTGLEGRAGLVPGLTFGLTAQRSEQAGAGSINLGGDVSWTTPLAGLNLDARVYRVRPFGAGLGAAAATSESALGGRYAIGRTQAGLRWETREFAASSGYRHLVADLTRSF